MSVWRAARGLSLFARLALALVLLTAGAKLLGGGYALVLLVQEHATSQAALQAAQTEAAAIRISHFLREIEGRLTGLTLARWSETSSEARQRDALLLLRQAPAITELVFIGPDGQEGRVFSRLKLDMVQTEIRRSGDSLFERAQRDGIAHGTVFFRRESEPFMPLAAGSRARDGSVVIAQVNLKHIWELVESLKIGASGHVHVLDGMGRLIAHPDISLVLRKLDLSDSAPFRASLDGSGAFVPISGLRAPNLDGRNAVLAVARVEGTDWRVVSGVPEAEADAPVHAAMRRATMALAAAIIAAIAVAVLLARRMARPIQLLSEGAERIGAGDLSHRIRIETGDEIEALSQRFNEMSARLQESYARLEQRVRERTAQIDEANRVKTRFLAAASHDLRQPLHALTLLVEQLRSEAGAEPSRLQANICEATRQVVEIFASLLDISKLDAGIVTPKIEAVRLQDILDAAELTYASEAVARGLRLRVQKNRGWVMTDRALIQRIVNNLLSNAIRYSTAGAVLIGARRRSGGLRVDVIDTGPGIAAADRARIFEEFTQVRPDRGQEGLGLGLAIVERLTHLLGHRLELESREGAGSRFSLLLPLARAPVVQEAPDKDITALPQRSRILLVEDDALAREAMRGLLCQWGYQVDAAASCAEGLRRAREAPPDLIISDFELQGPQSGTELIAVLRAHLRRDVPAIVLTGQARPDIAVAAEAIRCRVLHKPVAPLTLRAWLRAVTPERETSVS